MGARTRRLGMVFAPMQRDWLRKLESSVIIVKSCYIILVTKMHGEEGKYMMRLGTEIEVSNFFSIISAILVPNQIKPFKPLFYLDSLEMKFYGSG
jgi:hypothetical protein